MRKYQEGRNGLHLVNAVPLSCARHPSPASRPISICS